MEGDATVRLAVVGDDSGPADGKAGVVPGPKTATSGNVQTACDVEMAHLASLSARGKPRWQYIMGVMRCPNLGNNLLHLSSLTGNDIFPSTVYNSNCSCDRAYGAP